ncbi:MAG: SDR family oxidoreductase [Planctomycetes bacterium]|nr:SDR family oxidoreductase [Planctomycetota bacterium]
MNRNPFDISGRVVAVTGSEGLIGRELVKLLLAAGARVVCCDVGEQSRTPSGQCRFERFDICDPEGVTALVAGLLSTEGRLDGWVNLAYPRTEDWGKRLEEVSHRSFCENLDMQLGGTFWCSRVVLEAMKGQGSGSLVNYGSIYGVVGPHFDIYESTPGMTMPVAYAAIKGGVVNLTRYLAAYYGKAGLRVNAVCPGGVKSLQGEAFEKAYSSHTPLGRMATGEEAAAPALFLLSDAASYITGQALMVDGGWTSI